MQDREARELLQAFQAGKISRRELIVKATTLGLSLGVLGSLGLRPANAAAMTEVKIGVDLPMSGGEAPNGVPTNNGVQMAIDEANAAGGMYHFSESLKDDAVNGVHDPAQGAKNVQELIADSSVIGIVGNFNSNVAKAASRSRTPPGSCRSARRRRTTDLTKPRGALDLRKTHPDQINYFRVCTTDDIQGPVGADFAFTEASRPGSSRSSTIRRRTARASRTRSRRSSRSSAAGSLSHDGIPKGTQDFHAILTKIKSETPTGLFFGGVTTTGGGLIRQADARRRPERFQVLGGDGIVEDEFLKVAGDAADGTPTGPWPRSTPRRCRPRRPSSPPTRRSTTMIRARTARTATCAPTSSSRRSKPVGPNREKVRAWVANLKSFKSILGTFGFDKNGDTTNRIISVYKVEGRQVDLGRPGQL